MKNKTVKFPPNGKTYSPKALKLPNLPSLVPPAFNSESLSRLPLSPGKIWWCTSQEVGVKDKLSSLGLWNSPFHASQPSDSDLGSLHSRTLAL